MHKSTLPLFPSLDECPQLVVSQGAKLSKDDSFVFTSLHHCMSYFYHFYLSRYISWYYILIPVNKSKAVRLGTRLFSNDALPQWSLLYKCCLPVVGLLKSRPWKTLKRGCTTVLWQDMQSNVVREHPVILSAYAVSIGSAKATRTRQMKLPGMTSLTSFGICHAAVSPLDLIEQGLSPVGSGQALQGVDKHQLATQWKTTVLLCGNYHMSVYVYVYWCIIGRKFSSSGDSQFKKTQKTTAWTDHRVAAAHLPVHFRTTVASQTDPEHFRLGQPKALFWQCPALFSCIVNLKLWNY